MKHVTQLAETVIELASTSTASESSVTSNEVLIDPTLRLIKAVTDQIPLPLVLPAEANDPDFGGDPSFITRACLHCGALFKVPVAKKKGRKQIYCSHSCALKYYAKHVRDKTVHSQKIATYFQAYPARRILAATKRSAKSRGLIFDLTEEWIKERLQTGRCEISGLPIKIKVYKEQDAGSRSFFSPSIDRIDNNLGYIPSNCRLVCWGYNACKQNFSDRNPLALAIALVLNSIHPSMQAEFLSLLPKTVLAALPSGHDLF